MLDKIYSYNLYCKNHAMVQKQNGKNVKVDVKVIQINAFLPDGS